MPINRDIISQETGKPPIREALQTKVIASDSMKNIKRKNSFIFNSNSSDDYPSSHASIYEAVHISANSSEDSGHKIELIHIPPRRNTSVSKNKENLENSNDVQSNSNILSDNSGFLYGRGTVLDTITEQKSFATIQSIIRSKSVEDLGSPSFLRDSLALSNSLRRKISFSLDDIQLINRSYHEACAMIERKTLKLFSEQQVYAQPNNPIEAPLERPGTPPGMPSWTAAQNLLSTHTGLSGRPTTQNRHQRRFGVSGPRLLHNSRLPQDSNSRYPTNTNSTRDHIVPRFRPLRSTYTPLNQHPFFETHAQKGGYYSESRDVVSRLNISNCSPRNNSSGNLRKLRHVRFTPSILARDSETVSQPINPRTVSETATYSSPSGYRGIHVALKRRSIQNEDQKTKPQCSHSKGRKKLEIIESSPIPSRECNISSANSRSTSFSHNPVTVESMPINSDYSSTLGSLSESTNRCAFLSSTTPLTTGAPTLPSMNDRPNVPGQHKNICCWKCKVEHIFKKFDQLWMKVFRCVCFICCGFDVDDDIDVVNSPHRLAIASSRFSDR